MKIYIIGGLGRIGLVMAAVLGRHHEVFVNDTNTKSCRLFHDSKKPNFYEKGLYDEMQKADITISYNLKEIKHCDFIFVTIGTFVDEYLNPKFNALFDLFKGMKPYIKNNQVISICSTVYPGTTEKIEKLIGHSVAFCPERVSTSNMLEEFKTLPQIISSSNSNNTKKLVNLFTSIGINTITMRNTKEAELVKLFTNAYRYIDFAISNQFYMLAEKFGCDYSKIETAMKYKYPRMKNFKKPGFAGGSCLIKDTLQLAAHDYDFPLGDAAFRINEKLPLHIFRKVRKYFKGDLSNKTIGILGMTFKGNTDDTRDSLAFRVRNIFRNECKEVLCSDVYVKEKEFVSTETLIKNSDLIIVGACHNEYKDLFFSLIPIIDLRNEMNQEGI